MSADACRAWGGGGRGALDGTGERVAGVRMLHLCVRWLQDGASEPVWLFSELDDGGRETRKVSIWGSGSHTRSLKGVALRDRTVAREPFPGFAALGTSPGFRVQEITPAAFELVWNRAIAREALLLAA